MNGVCGFCEEKLKTKIESVNPNSIQILIRSLSPLFALQRKENKYTTTT